LRETTSPVLKAASWLVAVHLLGITIGAVAGQQIFIHVHSSAAAPLTAPARHAHFVESLLREVNLTDVQRQSLDAVLNDTSRQLDAIHQQTDNQISQSRMRARDQIRAILTPDQRSRFDEWLRKLEEERNRSNRQAEHK
jgi:Spy/CpxP family protein refolding chaperone